MDSNYTQKAQKSSSILASHATKKIPRSARMNSLQPLAGQRSHEAVRWLFGPADEDLVTDKEDNEVEEANEESSNEDEGDDEARTSEIA
ncbi:hypothetical protein ACH5RR_021444 [Cinchona calisaya]|uniref:Uncharacterized protein n=1 Tax=Cinchona calisaya TaxID=153742 RepID=A0ABD2ZHB5_9GENT